MPSVWPHARWGIIIIADIWVDMMGLTSMGPVSSGAAANKRTSHRGRVLRQRAFANLLKLVYGFFLLLALPAAAVLPERFTRFSVEQGLSQSTVQAMLQDRRGFLWFGTEEGLNRYDGYSFVVFKNDPTDPKSLPDSKISALHEDRRGRLWVGTWKGLSLFDYRAETFTAMPQIHNRIDAILEDADGTLWVATDGEGLWSEAPADGTFHQYMHQPKDPNSLGSSNLSSVLRDHKGRLWIGTLDAGIDRFDEASRQFIHYRADTRDERSLSANEVWQLAEDGQGKIWIATYGGGLNTYDEKTGGFEHYRHSEHDPSSIRTDRLTTVFADHSGTLWIGTDGSGLERYDQALRQFVALTNDRSDPFSLSSNVVRSIYEDRQSQLWVGTYLGGANLLGRQRGFAFFTHRGTDRQSLSAPAVASFLEDDAGHIWIGTEGGWLDRFDPQSGKFVAYRFPFQDPGGAAVMCLHQDKRGRIWVGTYRGGLARFNPKTGAFQTYRHTIANPKSVANDEIWAIEEDAGGKLWLGTNDGLDRFDPDSGVVLSHYGIANLGGVDIRTLHFDRQGNLWVGTLGVLDLLPRESTRFVHYENNGRDPNSLSHPSVSRILEDHKGRIWIGTLGDALYLYNSVTRGFAHYKNLPSTNINGMEEDNTGQLWISTNHGLSRFDPESDSVENFDLSNGLQDLQFHLGASLKRQNGRLLFGSTDGFYDFDPAEITRDTYAPPVVFTSLRIFNEPAHLSAPLSTLNQVTLSARDKIFSIEFAALDYTFPRHNRYAYRLEGFSNQWIALDVKREVTFTNLDPGAYVFRVKASHDGVWNEQGASLEFRILPAFYQTNWFYALCLMLLACIAWAAYQWRIRLVESRLQLQFEARLTERTRIARDLHDTMLQSFQGVLLKFYALSYILDRPTEARQTLEGLVEQAQQAITEGREAVQGLRSSTVITNDLAGALTQLGERLAAEQDGQNRTAFRVGVEGESRELHPIMRDEVYHIASEAIRNAFHHSGAARIELDIRYGERQFRVRIRDNGRGIDPKVLDAGGRVGHYGLPGMKERAKSVGGKVAVWSKVDSGTEAELTIPASRAYAKSRTPRRSIFLTKGV